LLLKTEFTLRREQNLILPGQYIQTIEKSSTTHATSGTRTAYPSEAPEFARGFH